MVFTNAHSPTWFNQTSDLRTLSVPAVTQGCVATPKYNRAQSSLDRIGSMKAEEHRGPCHRSENSILFRILWDAHLMSSCSRFGYPVLKRCSRREKQQTMFDLPREIVYRRELVSIST